MSSVLITRYDLSFHTQSYSDLSSLTVKQRARSAARETR